MYHFHSHVKYVAVAALLLWNFRKVQIFCIGAYMKENAKNAVSLHGPSMIYLAYLFITVLLLT